MILQIKKKLKFIESIFKRPHLIYERNNIYSLEYEKWKRKLSIKR